MLTFFTTLAANIDLSGGKGLQGIGPLGLEGKSPNDIPTFFPEIISKIVGVLSAAAILWFIIQFIMAAYAWIGSSGDPKAIENARTRLIHAIIGLTIVFVAMVILSFVGNLFGVDLLDLGKMITNLRAGGSGGSTPGVGIGTTP